MKNSLGEGDLYLLNLISHIYLIFLKYIIQTKRLSSSDLPKLPMILLPLTFFKKSIESTTYKEIKGGSKELVST